jgi:cytochrome c556
MGQGPGPEGVSCRSVQAKLALLLVVLVSAALVAGCGGGSHPLSKAGYEAKMQTLGDKFGKALGSLGALANPTSAEKTASKVAQAQKLLKQAADELAQIEPPKDIAAAHREYTEGVRELSDKFGEVAKEVRAGDLKALQKLASADLEATRKIEDGARKIKAKGYDIGSAG